jgi:uncharacterized OB-fold protein
MEIPRHRRWKAQRYRLEGAACLTCGLFLFPPRAVCPHCGTTLTQISGWTVPEASGSMQTTDFESRMKYEMIEKTIG